MPRAVGVAMHPSERLRGATSRLLEGKTIVLAVTGSIAAVRTVELARELIRHGAHVVPVMSKDAQKIIHPYALEFATGMKPITEITGRVEHVAYLGLGGKKADLFLVAPATGNTLSKMALGIDDGVVTTFFSTGMATTPTLVAPAMHEPMYDNPFLVENLKRLEAAGVGLVPPLMEEGKAKLPEPEVIVEHVLRALGPKTLQGRRILVVNGSTVEPLDTMRVITNKSTGRTGAAIVREAFRMGADVEHWWGHGHLVDFPHHIDTRRFVTVKDLMDMIPKAGEFDAVLFPAAVSDFGPTTQTGKVSSEVDKLTLELTPLPKVIDAYQKAHPNGMLISFKAEAGITETQLIEKARRSLARAGSRFVVANRLEEVDVDKTRILLVDAKNAEPITGDKAEAARAILDRIAKELNA